MSELSPALTRMSVALIAVSFAAGIAGATATTDDTVVTLDTCDPHVGPIETLLRAKGAYADPTR